MSEHDQKLTLGQVGKEIAALVERQKALLGELQQKCKHAEVVEHDRGSNNFAVRVCTNCTLRENAWADELGMARGFNKLVGAEGRTIKPVSSMAEISQYETLR